MFDDCRLLIDDALESNTILIPQALLKSLDILRQDLNVRPSPDDAVYCSRELYDSLTSWSDLLEQQRNGE